MKLQMFFRIQDRHGSWHQHDWYVCVFVNCWGQWKPCRSFRKETSEIRHVSFCVSANLASMRNFLGNVRKDIVPDYDYRKKNENELIYLNSPTDGASSWFLEICKIQLNRYETGPNFIQLNQNLTSDGLLISVF